MRKRVLFFVVESVCVSTPRLHTLDNDAARMKTHIHIRTHTVRPTLTATRVVCIQLQTTSQAATTST